MTRISQCPVCESHNLTPFLERNQVPTTQNVLMTTPDQARNISRGVLLLAVCESCGFVFNQTFDPTTLYYGDRYNNNQGISPAFQNHITSLIEYLVNTCAIRNVRIVEVGCGQGDFLRALIAHKSSTNSGYGFDPSYLGPLSDLDGRLQFAQRYYDESCADIPADVVISRHVIEHVPNPISMLCAIKKAVTNSPHARLFFETPDVKWILKHQVMWDFFYEHCSLFTPASLSTAFQRAGFSIQNIRHVFGGQYQWLEAVNTVPATVQMDADETPQLARQFAARERILLESWLNQVRKLAKGGKIALCGAGAKGVTFANLVDPDCTLIDCVADLNPQKQGKYLPGTGHPIVNYDTLTVHNVKTALLLNPNYYSEVRSDLDSAIHLVNMMETLGETPN
jgi:Methyltransferase domain/C-methyltransferase C-terminal domain